MHKRIPTHHNRRDSEAGFTLIELLVAISISSVIIAAIAGAFIVTAANYSSSATRITESNDAQLLTAWLDPDVTSAGAEPTNVNVAATANPCAIVNPGTSLASLSWTGFDSTGMVTGTDYADYMLQGSTLTRYFCTVNPANQLSAATAIRIGSNVAAPGASGSLTGVTVNGSQVIFTITDNQKGTLYTYTVSASRRTTLAITFTAPASAYTYTGPGTGVPAGGVSATISGIPSALTVSGTVSITVLGPSPTAPTSCTGGVSVGTIPVSSDGAFPSTIDFNPTSVGNYWWYATYTQSPNNISIASPCPSVTETTVKNQTSLAFSTVAPKLPTLVTNLGTIAATSISATLTGAVGGTGATMQFIVFGPSTTPPTNCNATVPGATPIGPPVSVSGSGTYHPTTGFTPTQAGAYWWYAAYSGDANNISSQTPCAPTAETVIDSSAPAFGISPTGDNIPATAGAGTANVQLLISGFGPNESLSFQLNNSSGVVLSTSPTSITTDAGGGAGTPSPYFVKVPTNMAGGSYAIYASDSGGFSATSNSYSIVPGLSFTAGQNFPYTVGGSLTGGSGAGFGRSERITFHLGSATGPALSTNPGSVNTNTSGIFSVNSVTIPPEALGTYSVVAVGTANDNADSNTFTEYGTATCTLSAGGKDNLTEDTYIDSASPGTVEGGPTTTRMQVGNSTNSLVQFGILSGNCNETNSPLTSAGPILNVTDAVLQVTAPPHTFQRVAAAPADSSWSTASLDWTLATPQEQSPQYSDGNQTVFSTRFPVPVQWTVTHDVKDILSGSAIDGGWVIFPANFSFSTTDFYTRENGIASEDPVLTISYWYT